MYCLDMRQVQDVFFPIFSRKNHKNMLCYLMNLSIWLKKNIILNFKKLI